MTTVVLLVLAGVWAVVLFSWFRRSRAEGSFTDSVGSFRRDMKVLRRTSPGAGAESGPFPTSAVWGTPQPSRGINAFGYGVAPSSSRSLGGQYPVGRSSLQSRRQSQKRRRDVLLALVAMVLLSLVLAITSGSSGTILLQVATDILLVAYIALLVRMRNTTSEREMNVHVMNQYRRAPVSPAIPQASYQVVYDHSYGGGRDYAYRQVAS